RPRIGNDPGGALRLALSPRRDDSSRLVDEVAHRCGRGVISPPVFRAPGWRVDSGRVMARHWQDACVDAVAKLPPLRARRFSETIRVELGAFLSIRAATTHPDSSTKAAQQCGRGVIAPPAPLGPGWRVTGGGVMARYWQDACVDEIGRASCRGGGRFSERVGVELGALVSVRGGTADPYS